MKQVIGHMTPVMALERSFVCVKHRFQRAEKGLEGYVDVNEDIDDPGRRADTILEFKRVTFQHGNQFVDGKHRLGQVQSWPKGSELFTDGLIWQGFAFFDSLLVGALKEILPGGPYIGWVSVIGCLID